MTSAKDRGEQSQTAARPVVQVKPNRAQRRRRRPSGFRILTLVLLTLGAIFMLLPLVWLISTAFRQPQDAFAMPPKLVSKPTLSNFSGLLGGSFGKSVLNSAIVAVAATAVSLVLGVPAGYAMSRSKIKFAGAINAWFVLAYVAPPIAFIVPMYIMYQHLGLLDTYTGLVLAYLTGLLPFTTWLMRIYFNDVPRELDEAGWIDGCSKLRGLWSVVLPTVWPGVLSVGLLVGLAAWGEYFAAVILTGPRTETAPVAVTSSIGTLSSDWGQLAAAGLIVVIPALLATISVQRGFVQGLGAGAVKQ